MKPVVSIQENNQALIQFESISLEEFNSWVEDKTDELNGLLYKHGSILFRGLPISGVVDFEYAISLLSGELKSYVDGNSPRTKLTGKTYTSTEYDQDHHITLHNELSYSSSWPEKLFFCCIEPAEIGGETPLADCRKVLQEMDKSFVDEVEAKGLVYIRNLHSGNGNGPSWHETYETNNKTDVENYLNESNTEFQWNKDDSLRIVQRRSGLEVHPKTNEKVWFNQIDQFHPVHLSSEIYETLLMLNGGNEEELPMYVTYGDGSKISPERVKQIESTVHKVSVSNKWEKGDLLMIDNVLVSHGRNPFKGKRKIIVSMS